MNYFPKTKKNLNRGLSRLFTWVSLEFNAWRGRNSIRLPRWSTFDWRDVRRSYTFMLNFCRWMLISTCTPKKMYIFSIAVCARVLSTSYTCEQYALHYNWIQRFLFSFFSQTIVQFITHSRVSISNEIMCGRVHSVVTEYWTRLNTIRDWSQVLRRAHRIVFTPNLIRSSSFTFKLIYHFVMN